MHKGYVWTKRRTFEHVPLTSSVGKHRAELVLPASNGQPAISRNVPPSDFDTTRVYRNLLKGPR